MNLKIKSALKSTAFFFAIIITPFAIKAQQANKTYIIDDLVVNTTDEINPDVFYEKAIESIIIDQINTILLDRNKQIFTENELLKKVAIDQAEYMANIDEETPLQDNKEKATTADRMQFYGGSKHAEEIVDKNNINKGKLPYSYGKVCDEIVFRLFNSSKNSAIIESEKYNLIGIGAKLGVSKKRVYVSIVTGNYQSFNDGVAFKEKLAIPYSEKTYGITEANNSFCKRIYRNNNLQNLQDGLSVQNGMIYFESEDIGDINKLLRNKKDALAVDILQKDQFSCENPNIIDHNLINTGVLTKRVYAKKLFSTNIANIEENKKAFKTTLGYLPEGLYDNYELNLVIIQNKSACISIPQSFVIQTSGTYSRKVELLADTVTINAKYQYKPVADSMLLSFRIPFENKKFTYKTEDIEPFLKLLNEPAFIIYDLKIKAYSSIEGTEKENRFLQEERAKSIVQALKERQKENIATEIITDYSWSDFKAAIQNSQHNIMASMSLEEAQDYIRKYNLKKELEPILQNQRYAEIKMKVTYDISGNNEQPYVLKKFNNAISAEDRPLALAIQKFVIKQIMNKRYDISVLNEMKTPEREDYAGMEMNRVWMLYKYKQMSVEDFVTRVEELNTLNRENEYIAFNNMLNYVNYSPLESITGDYNITQSKIDRLYYTPLKKSTVDALNVRFQFKIINAADSVLNNQKIREASIEKIKEIVDIKDESMNNALKLAEIFIENNDFPFARKSIEPWIDAYVSNEKLVFTYISLCSLNENLMHTDKFTTGMLRARELNPKRYCALFNGDGFSFKVFENNAIKSNYCEFCSDHDKVVDFNDSYTSPGSGIVIK